MSADDNPPREPALEDETAGKPGGLTPRLAGTASSESSSVRCETASDDSVATVQDASDSDPSQPLAVSHGPAQPPDAEPRKRVRLNPTLGKTDARPVSTLAAPTAGPSDGAKPQAAVKDGPPSEEEGAGKSAVPVPASIPVVVPLPQQSLDAEMEAEIEAALASGELTAVSVIPTVAEDAEESETTPEPVTEETLEEGIRLTGKIQSIHGDDVFLDVGLRSPGVVQARQFSTGKKPQVGQTIEVIVQQYDAEEGLILLNLPHGVRKVAGGWDSVAKGQTVDCIATGTNKGGIEVTIGTLRGFLPASQVDLAFVSDLTPFVGQQLRVQIMEVNPKKRNLIVSRRACLLVERKEAEKELWKSLAVGQRFSGHVKTLKDYGVFVDIGGVDGFLHIGDISWTRIKRPSDVLTEGQEVEVQVITLNSEKKKVGLGMRQLVTNPWTAVTMNYPAESTVTGRVTRVADFGAFVELEPGVEGLVHISELDHSRVRRVADVLKVDQEVDVKVLEVHPDKRRISLSIKALKARPEGTKPKSDADLAPGGDETYTRKRKSPLKGGTGDKSGGMFGNPADFG